MNIFDEVSESMIDKLSKYVLTKESFLLYQNKPTETIVNTPPSIVELNIEREEFNDKVVRKTKITTNEIFFPRNEDTLFWCIFIYKFSKIEFLQIETKYKNKEIEEKMKIVDFLTDLTKLKSMKISKTGCQEIRGDLSCSSKTNLFALHALCAFYDICVYVVNNENKTYIEYNNRNENDEICIIYKNGSLLNESPALSKYSIDLNITPSKIAKIQEEFFKFDSYNKALKAISTYKVIDLEKLATKFPGIKDKKMKKNGLYEAICAQLI